MKKHSSVIALLVRNKLMKAFIAYLFLIVLSVGGYVHFQLENDPFFGGEQATPILYWFFVIGYLLCVCALLELPSKKSKVQYTYQRLHISEQAVFFLEVLVNALFFLILLGIEICLLYFLAWRWSAASGYIQGHQGISMIFLRSMHFHGLVPLSETGLWVRNLLYMIGSGILTAGISVAMRSFQDSNKISMACRFLLLFGMLIDFPSSLGENSYIMAGFILFFTGIAFAGTLESTHNGH